MLNKSATANFLGALGIILAPNWLGGEAGFDSPTLHPIRQSCRQSVWGLRSDFAVPVKPVKAIAVDNGGQASECGGAIGRPDHLELAALPLRHRPRGGHVLAALEAVQRRLPRSELAIECRLLDTKEFGDCTVVFGEVVHIAVDEAVLRDGRPAIDLLRPVARLGAAEWSTIGAVTSHRRVPFSEVSS